MKPILLKILLIHVILTPFYFFTQKEVLLLPFEKLDTLLLFIGLIVIAPVTSNFIYGYKNAHDKNSLMWGHTTTFFSMLVIGILFVILDILLIALIGNVLVFRISIWTFWIAVITFDFADYSTRLSK